MRLLLLLACLASPAAAQADLALQRKLMHLLERVYAGDPAYEHVRSDEGLASISRLRDFADSECEGTFVRIGLTKFGDDGIEIIFFDHCDRNSEAIPSRSNDFVSDEEGKRRYRVAIEALYSALS